MTHHYLHHENLSERLRAKHCESFGLLGKTDLKTFHNKFKITIVTLQLSKHLHSVTWALVLVTV